MLAAEARAGERAGEYFEGEGKAKALVCRGLRAERDAEAGEPGGDSASWVARGVHGPALGHLALPLGRRQVDLAAGDDARRDVQENWRLLAGRDANRNRIVPNRRRDAPPRRQ